MNRYLQLCMLPLLLLCVSCASGPKPLVLPDGLFRSDINPPLDLTASAAPSSEPQTSQGNASSEPISAKSTELELATSKGATIARVETVIETPEPIWQLKKGETIRSELSRWAKDVDWSLVWQLDKDWVIPSNSQFSGSFDVASARVIETLASNGVLIHANFYIANKTLVVTGPGVTPQ